MKKVIIIAALLLGGFGANAQSNYQRDYLGYLPYFSSFWGDRMHELSMQSANLGTARSMAMGGAFTSLGADLSSMHINPAGLGMYRSSELGITMGPTISDMTSSMRGEGSTRDSRTSFALGNIGAAFNLFESAGNTTSFTLGIGYSRLADYNYRSSMDIANGPHSILDLYSVQAKNMGGAIADFDQLYLEEWGAALAYETWLIDADGSIPPLSLSADIYKNLSTLSKGSAGEYVFAGGWNFRNKFYFGFSLGIIDIYQNRESIYTEHYSNNTVADPATMMIYEQRMRTVGEGYNAKLGVVYRPIPELRIGVAFHTPSVIRIKEYYDSSMDALYGVGETSSKHAWIDEVEFANKFYSPSRLLAGVSYTIANRGIIAVDYERAFYNGMGVYSDMYSQTEKDLYRDLAKDYFEGSNTLRVGGEIMVNEMMFARAGYSYSQDGVRKTAREAAINGKLEPLELPVRYRSEILSAGFGVKFSDYASFDMTYSLLSAKYTDYDTFYVNSELGTAYPGAAERDMTRQKLSRHNIMLGLSMRF